MTSRAHTGMHLAAAAVATSMTAAACGEVPNPAPRSPVAAVRDGVPKPAPQSADAGVKFEMPRRKKAVKPSYQGPRREANIPVMLTLDETGKVVRVKILEESEYPELNEAVRRTAMAEEFTPAMRDGVPVAFSISFTYRFYVLEDE
jgi:TonB family protein